jgi:hypothetical protein
MLHIKENNKPHLKQCEMVCDVKLHSKLDQWEMMAHCFQTQSTTAVIGKPRSGKSSWLYSMMTGPLKRCFTKIFYICPPNSASSQKDNVFLTLPDEQIFTELDEECLDTIIGYCEGSDKDEKICIVIDDMAFALKNPEVQKALKKIAFNKRHLHIFQTFIISQTWSSVPKEVRRLYDNIILFKVGANDMKTLIEECCPDKLPYADSLVKLIYDKPHQYAVIRLDSGKWFKMFDEIIFPE